eukprot:358377-Chlamydomonas_euryale.AAC.3
MAFESERGHTGIKRQMWLLHSEAAAQALCGKRGTVACARLHRPHVGKLNGPRVGSCTRVLATQVLVHGFLHAGSCNAGSSTWVLARGFLHRASCTGLLAQGFLHRASCTGLLAQGVEC